MQAVRDQRKKLEDMIIQDEPKMSGGRYTSWEELLMEQNYDMKRAETTYTFNDTSTLAPLSTTGPGVKLSLNMYRTLLNGDRSKLKVKVTSNSVPVNALALHTLNSLQYQGVSIPINTRCDIYHQIKLLKSGDLYSRCCPTEIGEIFDQFLPQQADQYTKLYEQLIGIKGFNKLDDNSYYYEIPLAVILPMLFQNSRYLYLDGSKSLVVNLQGNLAQQCLMPNIGSDPAFTKLEYQLECWYIEVPDMLDQKIKSSVVAMPFINFIEKDEKLAASVSVNIPITAKTSIKNLYIVNLPQAPNLQGTSVGTVIANAYIKANNLMWHGYYAPAVPYSYIEVNLGGDVIRWNEYDIQSQVISDHDNAIRDHYYRFFTQVYKFDLDRYAGDINGSLLGSGYSCVVKTALNRDLKCIPGAPAITDIQTSTLQQYFFIELQEVMIYERGQFKIVSSQ